MLADEIRRTLDRHRLSVSALARQVGVHRTTVHRWLNGLEPEPFRRRALIKALRQVNRGRRAARPPAHRPCGVDLDKPPELVQPDDKTPPCSPALICEPPPGTPIFVLPSNGRERQREPGEVTL